jgi:hypothetical protein
MWAPSGLNAALLTPVPCAPPGRRGLAAGGVPHLRRLVPGSGHGRGCAVGADRGVHDPVPIPENTSWTLWSAEQKADLRFRHIGPGAQRFAAVCAR